MAFDLALIANQIERCRFAAGILHSTDIEGLEEILRTASSPQALAHGYPVGFLAAAEEWLPCLAAARALRAAMPLDAPFLASVEARLPEELRPPEAGR